MSPPPGETWEDWAVREEAAIRDAGQWRQPRMLDGRGPGFRLADGRDVISFASNDYLGLTGHPAVVAAAHAALNEWGTGSGAARLIVGSRPVHHALEAELAAWKGTDAAVLFPTGFAANLGVLSTLAGPGVTVVSDERNHASIVDGCRLAKATVVIARHCDAGHVDALLAAAPGRSLVVTDLVFSMDGDLAPVAELGKVCASHGALLVLDEAHLVLDDAGAADDLGGLEPSAVVRVGTLSKTLGSLGGFVAGDRRLLELLVNRARSYIFTTASTPADAAAARAALAVLRSAEGDALRARLRRNVDRLAPGHPSPILPVLIGEESRAVDVASRLLEMGALVPAIRPPTVAPGTSRLRIALSAAHTDDDLDLLAGGLDETWPAWRGGHG